jgi:hypothetical protein
VRVFILDPGSGTELCTVYVLVKNGCHPYCNDYSQMPLLVLFHTLYIAKVQSLVASPLVAGIHPCTQYPALLLPRANDGAA